MYQSFKLLRLIMLCVFAVVCAGLWGYQVFYIWPRKACEARGDWWDNRDRACAVPVPLSTWTGRPTSTVAKPLQKPAAKPAGF